MAEQTSAGIAASGPLTLAQLRAIMPHAPASYLTHLNAAMTASGINTPKRRAAFLAQIAVESDELRRARELYTTRPNYQLPGVTSRSAHTATDANDYFNYWYGNRMGNAQPDDGYRFRGRGLIQLTGRNNYQEVGTSMGLDLVNNPDQVSNPQVSTRIAAHYFARSRGLNVVADTVNPSDDHSVRQVNRRITHAVNGGYNHVEQRLQYYRRALEVLGAAGGAVAPQPSPTPRPSASPRPAPSATPRPTPSQPAGPTVQRMILG